MKRILGLCSFSMAIGMMLMLFIDTVFVAVILIAVLLLLGYNLFDGGCC
ncbi:MAG: hypothetical protein J6B19_00960 [Lachnospiraceae bacterium]|nr:hypothetical protein [Lachnospiraceae bacterium]